MVKNSCRAQRTVSVNVTLWSKQPNLLKLFPTGSAQTRAVREYNVNNSQIDKKMLKNVNTGGKTGNNNL